jgi:predicted nucleic acid-binding protein
MDEIGGASRIYVDTNIWIYYIEANAAFVDRVRAFFVGVEAAGAKLVTNEIAIAECLYKPSKDGNTAALKAYERLFDSGEVEITPLDGGLARRAAVNGGQLGLKLIDAIHYVSALEWACDFFVTSDSAFKSGPMTQVIRIGP